MKKQAVIAIRAIAMAREVIAFWHAPQIKFVKELAGGALFTKAAEPMLADQTAWQTLSQYRQPGSL